VGHDTEIAATAKLQNWQDFPIVTVMTGEMTLRDRKKLATRLALSRAALRLTAERSFDDVTPESIAAAADVSPRTFRNYFASKEEAIVAEFLHGAHEFAAALRARPAEEPIWQSLRAVLARAMDVPVDEQRKITALMRLAQDHPALLAQLLTVFETVDQELAEVIAERTGTDLHRDLYPRLLASAGALCVKTALDLWAEGAHPASLSELVDDALDQVSRGLPVPTA
jgi:AcrR family transcriptional regulator